ncbi:hypothetical protein ABZX51_003460 [Aspergillus tubingensis]
MRHLPPIYSILSFFSLPESPWKPSFNNNLYDSPNYSPTDSECTGKSRNMINCPGNLRLLPSSPHLSKTGINYFNMQSHLESSSSSVIKTIPVIEPTTFAFTHLRRI